MEGCCGCFQRPCFLRSNHGKWGGIWETGAKAIVGHMIFSAPVDTASLCWREYGNQHWPVMWKSLWRQRTGRVLFQSRAAQGCSFPLQQLCIPKGSWYQPVHFLWVLPTSVLHQNSHYSFQRNIQSKYKVSLLSKYNCRSSLQTHCSNQMKPCHIEIPR